MCFASSGDPHSQPSRSLQQNASVLVFTPWMQQEGIDAQPYAFGWCEDADFGSLFVPKGCEGLDQGEQGAFSART